MGENFGNAWPASRRRRRMLARHWWANGIPKWEHIDPSVCKCVLYRHATDPDPNPGVLIQWYEGHKPRTQPMWFFPEDLGLLRRDMDRGWQAYLRKPNGETVPLDRHDTHDYIREYVGADAPRPGDPEYRAWKEKNRRV